MPTIYIDCTSTLASRINTGIQRVVRNIARHAPEVSARHGYSLKLVAIRDGRFFETSLRDFRAPQIGGLWQNCVGKHLRITILTGIAALRHRLSLLDGSPAWRNFINAPYYRFGLARCMLYPLLVTRSLVARLCNRAVADKRPACAWVETDDLSGDILLLADSSWNQADCWPAAWRFKQRGGYVASVIYDLIPLTHPQFHEPFLVGSFTKWLKESVGCVDFYICISRSTEASLRTFLRQVEGTAQTGHFHLGSDLDLTRKDMGPSQKAARVVADGGPLFLVVGSLEPRKNVTFILDAFEHIWLQNPAAKLVLVGHNTWKVGDLLARIKQHPMLDTGLFWIRDASDTDLEFLYANATGLVFASMIEGFGLPIVEAMQRGLPVICSDIPVFREIADGKAAFFSLDTTDQLVEAVRLAAEASADGQPPARRPHPWLTWRESTDILIDKLDTQFRLDRREKGAACG